jgi:hypothetical protein
MTTYANEQQSRCFKSAQQRIAVIASVGLSHLVCAEEFARGYAQGLAEAGVLSFDQRDALYALADDAVEQRKRKL